jgi:hypothetical protein
MNRFPTLQILSRHRPITTSLSRGPSADRAVFVRQPSLLGDEAAAERALGVPSVLARAAMAHSKFVKRLVNRPEARGGKSRHCSREGSGSAKQTRGGLWSRLVLGLRATAVDFRHDLNSLSTKMPRDRPDRPVVRHDLRYTNCNHTTFHSPGFRAMATPSPGNLGKEQFGFAELYRRNVTDWTSRASRASQWHFNRVESAPGTSDRRDTPQDKSSLNRSSYLCFPARLPLFRGLDRTSSRL